MVGKIALITGANRGLGRSMAEHLVADGWGVIGTYHSGKREAEEVAGDAVVMLPLDVSDASTFPAFADAVRVALHDRFDREHLDALVNNAGIGTAAPFAEFGEDDFDRLIAIQFKAPFFLTQRLLPLLADGSRVLNVSSGLARFSNPGMSAYASTKGAIEVLTRYQALELGPRGIRVNVLAPGAVATDFGGGRVRDSEQAQQALVATTALGRVAQAADIGAAVPLILADGFAWATGSRIELSGGQRL